MKNIALTSSETDRKVVGAFSSLCRPAIMICCWFFVAFVIYSLTAGLVLGATQRSKPPGWAIVYCDPALRTYWRMPRTVNDAFISYVEWWDKVLHKK
jgi:hypothetical protein